MLIPTTLGFVETLHGHGADGMAFYQYRDSVGAGVTMEVWRPNWRTKFKERWFHDALPGMEFTTLADLRVVVAGLSDEIVAKERAKYPRIVDVKPDTCGNRCRLCTRGTPKLLPTLPNAPSAVGERVFYHTHRVEIARSWKDVHTLSLCEEHRQQYQDDAKGLWQAMLEEVSQRRVRAEANQAIFKANTTGVSEDPNCPF